MNNVYLNQLTLVGAGGFIGSVLRFMISGWAQVLAGATVFRGMEGFSAHRLVHTAKVLRLSIDLPILIEIVDTNEKIEAFLPIIDDAIPEGLATVERVEIRFYRSRKDQAP